MIERIDLFMPPYSLYNVLHHFTRSLFDALSRTGVHCRLLTAQYKDPAEFIDKILKDPPDCTLSFNGLLPDEKGNFLCDMLRIPHVACLVDSPQDFLSLVHSPFSVITCVDRFACDFFQGMHFQNVIFMPHAADRNIFSQSISIQGPRPYDVLLLGSYIDYDDIHKAWTKKYDPEFVLAILEAAEQTLTDPNVSYVQALAQGMDKYAKRIGGFDPTKVDFITLLSELENYIRGKDRITLVNSITDAKIDIFGKDSMRWKKHLKNPSKVVLHEAVPYEESLLLMQKSKIVLSSSPSFKQGAHERVFTGLASGAAVMTNNNSFLRENFKHGENILFHRYPEGKEVNDSINEYLNNPEKRYELISKGREIVRNNHTWDHRAAVLVNDLGPILQRIKEQR